MLKYSTGAFRGISDCLIEKLFDSAGVNRSVPLSIVPLLQVVLTPASGGRGNRRSS